MKIQNSSIIMASSHHETSFSYKESMTMEAAKSKDVVGAILTLSQEASGKSVKDAMVDYQKQEKEEAKKRQQENEARSIQEMAERMRTEQTGNQYDIPDDIDMKIKMLRQILAALRGEKVPEDCKVKPSDNGSVTDLRSAQFKKLDGFAFNLSPESVKLNASQSTKSLYF